MTPTDRQIDRLTSFIQGDPSAIGVVSRGALVLKTNNTIVEITS